VLHLTCSAGLALSPVSDTVSTIINHLFICEGLLCSRKYWHR